MRVILYTIRSAALTDSITAEKITAARPKRKELLSSSSLLLHLHLQRADRERELQEVYSVPVLLLDK